MAGTVFSGILQVGGTTTLLGVIVGATMLLWIIIAALLLGSATTLGKDLTGWKHGDNVWIRMIARDRGAVGCRIHICWRQHSIRL